MAEVLITLVVLGIIAAITVPTLRNSLDDKKYRVPLKKTYAVLSEAFDLAFNFSDLTTNDSYTIITKRFRELANNLGVAKVCCSNNTAPNQDECYLGVGSRVNACFAQPAQQDGTTSIFLFDKNVASTVNRSSFMLKDGTSVMITPASSSGRDFPAIFGLDTRFREVASVDGDCYYIVVVDVNGKKGPNIIGKDVHFFIHTATHGLLPAGVDSNTGTIPAGTCSGSDKLSCTYDYLNAED